MSTGPTIGSPDSGGVSRCRAFDIALGVLIAAVPLSYSLLAPHTLKWALIGFLTPLIAFLWLWGGCGRLFRPLPKLALPLFGLLLVSVLSLPQAINLHYGLQRIAFLVLLFLLYLTVAYASAQSNQRAKIIGYLVLTLLVVSGLSLYGCTLWHLASLGPAHTLFRLFGNTNYGAAYLLTVLPLSLALYINAGRRWERVLLGTTLFLSVALLSLSMVRGAWISIWIGIWFLVRVLFPRERPPGTVQGAHHLPQLLPLLVIGSAILAAYAFWPVCLPGSPSFGDQVGSIFDPEGSSLQLRLAYWSGTIQMIRDHFWTGVGIGNFALAFVPYRPALTYQGPTVQAEHPHNEYLNLWAEVGPLGVLVLLWLGVRVVRSAWHLAKEPDGDRGVLAGIFGSLAASAAYANLFYVMHAPAAAMNVAILLGLLDGMDRRAGTTDRRGPIRLPYLIPGFLIMALVCFQYFLRPLVGEIHYVLAKADFLQQRTQAGFNRLERSLAWDAESYEARYRGATAFFMMGKYPEAIEQAQEALHIHPNLEIAYWVIGSAYRKLGKKPEAKEMYLRALAVNPHYPHALNNLGVLAAEEGRLAEAETLFLRAREVLGRSDTSPYTNLGNLYETARRFEDALQMHETAAAVQPKSGANWYHVARLRAVTGDLREVYEPLARAIALDEAWRARAAKEPAFTALRENDPRVRLLLDPPFDGR